MWSAPSANPALVRRSISGMTKNPSVGSRPATENTPKQYRNREARLFGGGHALLFEKKPPRHSTGMNRSKKIIP